MGASVITRRKGSESQRDGTEISREICWLQRARDELEACCAQVTSAPAPADAGGVMVSWSMTSWLIAVEMCSSRAEQALDDVSERKASSGATVAWVRWL